MLDTYLYRIYKTVAKPFWKTRDRLIYSLKNRYNPKKYWKKRHKRYGFDLKGVGNCTLSTDENLSEYQKAGRVFLDVCKEQKIDWENSTLLDIGCGIGFYADIYRNNGGKDYLGIDITDYMFPQLIKKFPEFRFQKMDITEESPNKQFDVIIMIDVTQHIVDNQLFCSAMNNVKSCLSANGIFIVTSWLSEQYTKRKPYEVERPLEFYKKEFPKSYFSKPLHFRDKYIFSITNRLTNLEPLTK